MTPDQAPVQHCMIVNDTLIASFSTVGLSISLLTGLGGLLTLGQFAVASTAGVVSYYVSSHSGGSAVTASDPSRSSAYSSKCSI